MNQQICIRKKNIFVYLVLLLLVSFIFISYWVSRQHVSLNSRADELSTINHQTIGAPLNGTFMVTDIPENKISSYMDELKGLGMNTVIIYATRTKPDTTTVAGITVPNCSGNDFYWTFPNPNNDLHYLSTVLGEAQKRNISVYIGLTHTMGACPTFYLSPNADTVINDMRATTKNINDTFNSSPAFAGWYIPDEPALMSWLSPPVTYGYYKNIVDAIHFCSTKPILVAPYLVNNASKSPQDVALIADDFKKVTKVDVEIWQDGVGVEGVNIGWRNSYTLRDYYQVIAKKIGINALWSDNELFNCCKNKDVVGGYYRPTSLIRLNTQLTMSDTSYVSKRVTWIQQQHMGTISPNAYPEGSRLMASYKALYGLGGEYIKPYGYTWISAPSIQYPDPENKKLFDGMTGDPTSYADSNWVGVLGNAEVVVDLGASKRIDWVGIHVLDNEQAGIRFPNNVQIMCSQDGSDRSYSSLGQWPTLVEYKDSEYIVSNPSPLAAYCRYLKVNLTNSKWTFMSEIELVSSSTIIPTLWHH